MNEREPLGQAELDKANVAYAQKRYGDARAYCKAAERNGASRGAVQKLERAIKAGEQQQAKRSQTAGWVGGLLALFAYIVLAFLPLSPSVHFAIALILIPAVCGLAIGRLSGFDFGAGSRFRRAAWVVARMMFLYGIVIMIWRRTRFEMGSESGQVFWVWFLVACIYALIAGLVAGIVGGKLAWLAGGKDKDNRGTAS